MSQEGENQADQEQAEPQMKWQNAMRQASKFAPYDSTIMVQEYGGKKLLIVDVYSNEMDETKGHEGKIIRVKTVCCFFFGEEENFFANTISIERKYEWFNAYIPQGYAYEYRLEDFEPKARESYNKGIRKIYSLADSLAD